MTGYPEQMPSLCLQELIEMFTSVEKLVKNSLYKGVLQVLGINYVGVILRLLRYALKDQDRYDFK